MFTGITHTALVGAPGMMQQNDQLQTISRSVGKCVVE